MDNIYKEALLEALNQGFTTPVTEPVYQDPHDPATYPGWTVWKANNPNGTFEQFYHFAVTIPTMAKNKGIPMPPTAIHSATGLPYQSKLPTNPGGQVVPPQAGGKINPQPFQQPIVPPLRVNPITPVQQAYKSSQAQAAKVGVPDPSVPSLGTDNSLMQSVLGARTVTNQPIQIPSTTPSAPTSTPQIPSPEPWGLKPY